MTAPAAPRPPCPRCASLHVKRDGSSCPDNPRYRCHGCRRTFTARTATSFAGYRWPAAIILTAVRWYGRYRLSVADVRDLLAERGIDVSARTVLSWVHTFGPLLAAEARRHARPLRRQWFCDETYVRVSGKWMYLYRAVDEDGQAVDVLLREHRDSAAAEAFFQQALARRGSPPEQIVTDKHQAYIGAVRRHLPAAEHVRTGLHRARGFTTKPIERSHVPVKDRLRPMRGLQSVRTGQCLIESLELARSVHRGFVAIAPISLRSCVHARARASATIYAALGQRLRTA